MTAALATFAALALLAAPTPASAGVDEAASTGVEGPAPATTTGEPAPASEIGERSRQGTRRGALEFGLGSLLAATAIGLIAYASVEVVRAGQRETMCAAGGSSSGGIDPCDFDPPALGYAAAGLGFGFSIPLFVGAGLLYARGARIHADARRWDARAGARLRALPSWGRHGGGLTLQLRF